MAGCPEHDVVIEPGKEQRNLINKEIEERFKSKLSEIEDVDESKSPFVVLVGNVGVGKSTITEKLTGETDRSSASSTTATISTEYFWVADKSLLIADTPGSNPRKRRFEHNLEIAAALNYKNVSKLLIVVKADVRMDQTLDDVKEFLDRFILLPDELIGIFVTHMDFKREWEENEMVQACKDDFGIGDVVFSRNTLPGEFIKSSILKICRKTEDSFKLEIDGRMFLRMFKIEGSHKRILRVISKIVDKFQQYKQCFEDEKKKFSSEEQADLFFEYKAFMELLVEESQKEMCNELDFDFCNKEEVNIQHAGYVASMVNQLRAIIYDIRIEALKYHNKHGSSDLRECPYCGCIWAKVEGCEGYTTCGAMPTSAVDINRDVFEMATFSFTPFQENDGKEEKLKFHIERSGKKILQKDGRQAAINDKEKDVLRSINPANFTHIGGKSFYNIPKEYMYLYKDTKGCRRRINWDYMKKVSAPEEFHVKDEGAHINTDDIITLPKNAKSVFQAIDRQLQAKKNN